MTKIRLPFIHEFRDRHGKFRRYVRLPGRQKQLPLPGAPGSGEFTEAYQAALAGKAIRSEIGAARTKPGTVNAAIISYFNSAAFRPPRLILAEPAGIYLNAGGQSTATSGSRN